MRRSAKTLLLLIIVLPLAVLVVTKNLQGEKREIFLKEAMFYQKMDNNLVWCQLCPRRCIIAPGKRGFCRVRENRGGKLYSLVYGKPCAVSIGPVEKKPLYHVIPGHLRLTLATVSCNLRCKHCHNWHISQVGLEGAKNWNLSPEEAVKEAIKQGVKSISFTYTEPTVFYEYMYDISKLAKKQGLKTLLNSNGFINPEPLKKLLEVMDAVNFDLKGFSEKFYHQVCSAELAPVLGSLKMVKEEGVHLEVINLIIPTLNDDPDEIRKMCEWIRENLGEDTPLHFTRFFPAYKLTHLPPTPVETLEKARRIAQKAGLKYVYIGNVPGHLGNNTYCPRCGKLLVRRIHFAVLANNIVQGKCKFCQEEIPGIWE
jgi:pyruvate formate lyase activating enzyme